MKNFLKIGFAGLALSLVTLTAASAATVGLGKANDNGNGNGGPPVVVQPVCSTATVTTSTACQAFGTNNDSAAQLNTFGTLGLFNVSNWVMADKSDDNALVAPFNLTITGAGTLSGLWEVDGYDDFEFATLVVKSSDRWVAYLLNTAILDGAWSTTDILNNGGEQPDLSHISLYVGGDQISATVPVPAAGLMLLAALGGLGALRRRRIPG